jgi:AcrR family transcriptional regulator
MGLSTTQPQEADVTVQREETAAERLRAAAFDLFAEHGYDATSVEAIAERAGVGRSTYFRTFRTKEEVIFPDHEAVLARLRERFDAASTEHTVVAVTEAARMVLRSYLDDGARAQARYALTRGVPALRAREIASMQQYQHAFREFIRTWLDDLPAELMAGAVVTAHNHVLRRWLRGELDDAGVVAAFEAAMAEVAALFTPRAASQTTVLVLGADADPDAVAEAVRAQLSGGR